MIWTNDECPNIGSDDSNSLDKCKQSCLDKNGCTAINYKDGVNCVLRQCTEPVPNPSWSLNGYEGHYLTKGTKKEI